MPSKGSLLKAPCACACLAFAQYLCVFCNKRKGCVLCASHRCTLGSQVVAVLDLEKNGAAWGKGLVKASLS